ncbi:MAG: sigma-54 dependent transcriptional regulator [Magnetococcus sp. WYHC-3]
MEPGKEILIVGDNHGDMGHLGVRIADAGYAPVFVPDYDNAKRHISAYSPGLVILSLETMLDPHLRIRELTFLFRGLPVLAAARGGNVHEAREIIAAGAADYLLLPLDSSQVRALLERYANQFFDPELGRGRRFTTADAGMKKLLTQVRRVAKSRATVLVLGESGTGKELIARYVHQVSDRSEQPFVAINCAALPENLLESELFGHAKGAFTGAMTDRKGKFQQAHGGTILLDEISEMSLNLQAKLLRVLQEGEVDPVGSRTPISLDVRVVAATNRDLKAWSEEGRFREDLYYRLNVFPVHLPPLRKRPADIPLLANHFRQRFVKELGRNDIEFTPQALQALQNYDWPGNVRELENVIQRALLMAEGSRIGPDDLMIDLRGTWTPPASGSDAGAATSSGNSGSAGGDGDGIHLPVGTTVREMEEILIRRTLDEVDGNRTRAAELLGISIRTLRNKLNEYAGREVE